MRALCSSLLFALVLGVSAAWSGLALAQDDPTEAQADDRASAFRSVSGPQVDNVPGGTLLIAAYGVAWVLVLGYLWRLGSLHTANAKELERLKSAKRDDE